MPESLFGFPFQRPICRKCCREFMPIKNDVMVKDKAVGNYPSTYWSGDLYKCPGCGAQIITGFGTGMTAEKAKKKDGCEQHVPMEVEMKAAVGSRTELVLEKVDPNAKLTEADFTEEAMQR